MTDDTNKQAGAPEAASPVVEAAAAPAPVRGGDRRGGGGRGGDRGRGGPRGGGRGGPRQGGDRARSEFIQKVIGMRRVARVMAGGRRFNFSVAMVIGDKKGRVGFGLGKAADTAMAIEKATNDAKKHMISVNLTKNNSIPHDVAAKYAASVVNIRPSKGSGLVAGSAVRVVLELAGVSDVTAKLHSRSKNPINNARVAIKALSQVAK